MKHKYIEASIESFLDYYMIVDPNGRELVRTKHVARGLLAHLEADGYVITEVFTENPNTEKEKLTFEKQGEPLQILIALKCQLVVAHNQKGEEVKIYPGSVRELNGGWIMAGDKGLYMSEHLADKFGEDNETN